MHVIHKNVSRIHNELGYGLMVGKIGHPRALSLSRGFYRQTLDET